MKKNILMVIMAAAMSASLLCACGDKKADTAPETKKEEAAEAPETKTEEVTEIVATDGSDEAAEETDEGFSLLDVDENMVDVGAYAMTDDKEELVFTMFTGPDQCKYVSLFVFDNNSDEGDVICGQYEAKTEVDEDGDEWTYFDVEDSYTGKHFNLGVCERPSTDQVCFFDENGNVVEGEFLTAADTIKYMGSAANLISQ